MNKLTTMNNTQTMTSREIAEVVEKRHDNVKRTNEGNDFFTINRVKELNPDIVFSGNKLTTKSNELGLPTTQFAPYNMKVPNAYHRKVWNLVYPKAKLP